MSENKITILGKEYQLKFVRGSKDINSGTLYAECKVVENEDKFNAQIVIEVRPQGEKILTYEPLFMEAVQNDFKESMDGLKKKQAEAIAKAKGEVIVEATAEVAKE